MSLWKIALALAAACLATTAAAQVERVPSIFNPSGTITTGGVSQTVFPGSASRSFIVCQNPITATETLFVGIGAPASTTGGSIELAPGGSITFASGVVPTGQINVAAATAGHRFICLGN